MSKHTPGPWKLEKNNCDWTIWGADGCNILGIPHDEIYGHALADSANARLIASAPELLEALETLMVATTMTGPVLAAAIKKAQLLIDRLAVDCSG